MTLTRSVRIWGQGEAVRDVRGLTPIPAATTPPTPGRYCAPPPPSH
ncbi:hypothetical protein [Streptomyces huiliensis]|nr:hypothetical protein [Streptomyces huiliensis]